MEKTVLVVDDEPLIATLLATLLQDEGFHVRCAHDGEDALRQVEREPPDLVLADVMMPKLDGIELTERLRDSGRATPVVLMSAVYRRVFVPGVRFVRKPFDLDQVVVTVRQALGEGTA